MFLIIIMNITLNNPIYNKTVNLSKKQYDKFLNINNIKYPINNLTYNQIMKNKIIYYPIFKDKGYKLEKFLIIKKFDKLGFIKQDKLDNYYIPRFIHIPIGVVSGVSTVISNKYSIPVYNILLKSYVWMSDTGFLTYLKNNPSVINFYKTKESVDDLINYEWSCYVKIYNNPDSILQKYKNYDPDMLYPYQSIDMLDMDVRLATEKDILDWLDNKKYVDQITNKYADYTSPIDIFKMKRNNDTNYKYLCQTKPEILSNIEVVNNVIYKYINDPNVNKIFIPNNLVDIELTKNNMDIYTNDNDVLKKIDDIISSNGLSIRDRGSAIHSLYQIYSSYSNYKTSDIDHYLQYSKKLLYGISKKDVDEFIKKFKKSVKNLLSENYDISAEFNKYSGMFEVNSLDELIELTPVVFVDKYYTIVGKLGYVNIALDKIVHYYFFKKNMLDKIVEHLNLFNNHTDCDNIFLRIEDLYEYKQNKCNKLSVDKKYNESIRLYLGDLDVDMNGDVYYDHIINPDMFNSILSNNYKEAHKQRQLIFGDYSITGALKSCSSLVLSDPWLELNDYIDLPNMSWSVDMNKTYIPCQLKKDMLFPISIYTSYNKPVSMYSCILDNNKDLVYVGVFLLKILGKRTNNKPRFVTLYLFYSLSKKRLLMYNFRGNRVMYSEINDFIKVFYIELNVLKYYKDDYDKNVNLYYYKVKDRDITLVSLKSLDEIKSSKLLTDEEISRLIPTTIEKDNDKQIFFSYINQNGGYNGGSDGINFDVKYTEKSIEIDKEYPKKIHDDYIEIVKNSRMMLQDDFYAYYYVISLNLYLLSIDVLKPDFDNKYVKNLLADIKNEINMNVVPYKFSDYIQIELIIFINKYKLNLSKKKTLIISKNCLFLEALDYYYKYILFEKNYSKNVKLLLYNYNKNRSDFCKSKEDHYIIDKPLNNKNIKEIIDDVEPKHYDMCIVDLNIYIKGELLRSNYSFQTVLSSMITAIMMLNIGGNIIFYINDITNKYIYDFFVYLSKFFDNFYIELESIVNYWSSYYTFLIYTGYKGGIDLDKLLEINKKNYECDPTGGFNYFQDDTKCFLKRIVGNQYDNNLSFKEYCDKISEIYQRKIELIGKINNVSKNRNSLNDYIKSNYITVMQFLKNNNFPIAEWIENNKFYENVINFININTKSYCYTLVNSSSKPIIGCYKDIHIPDKEKYDNMFKMSEYVYQYLDKRDDQKNIELFFNNKQKNLEKFLFSTYNININGRYVSRAYIKLYEMLDDVDFFNNLVKDNIKGFHICEAPGNFIISIQDYIKHKTQIKSYDYVAQSYYDGNIFDDYGLIKSNRSKWDFADGTGNIMSLKNLKYYLNKYKGVDILVGDCGDTWRVSKRTNTNSSNKDLAVYQLLYSLLLVRTGGNFIIKTFCTNFNYQYLSLLYVTYHKFDKVYIFRSSRNIWSPEIYIIGIGKRDISDKEEKYLLKIAEKLEDNEMYYPTDIVSPDLTVEYEYHIQNIIYIFSDIKKLFAYYVDNPEIYKKEKNKLSSYLDKRNIVWIEEHMNHLDNRKLW